MNNIWIQWAIEALTITGIVDKENGTCPRTYRSNISTLGAAIIQIGLVPALFSCARIDNKAGNEPHLIVKSLHYIILKSGRIPALKENDELPKYAFTHHNDPDLLRTIEQALIALKLAIRLFKQTDQGVPYKTESLNGTIGKNTLSDKNKNSNNSTEKVNNIGWYFTRRYYREFGKPDIDTERMYEQYNRSLFDTALKKEWKEDNNKMVESLGNMKFKLTTTYPGLLIGTGLSHGTGGIKNDLKMGFQFDYTTGLPYIPGSSLKGILRNMFPETANDNKRNNFIRSLLNESLKDLTDEGIVALKKDIFENGKDIFLDALITDSLSLHEHIMGEDYITPHSKALKNPIPLQIIKVLPNVEFSFPFRLQDSRIEGKSIKATDKLNLFKSILMNVGAGAKTNTGYGHFMEKKIHTIAGWIINAENNRNNPDHKSQKDNSHP